MAKNIASNRNQQLIASQFFLIRCAIKAPIRNHDITITNKPQKSFVIEGNIKTGNINPNSASDIAPNECLTTKFHQRKTAGRADSSPPIKGRFHFASLLGVGDSIILFSFTYLDPITLKTVRLV